MDVDAWGTKLARIFLDDGLAFWTNFEGFDLQMGELQTSLNRDAACAETDVPEHMFTRQFSCLKRQQTDGHLGNHLLTSVE